MQLARWKAKTTLTFQKGLFGFERHHHFYLQQSKVWPQALNLISQQDKKVAFVTIDPFVLHPDFRFSLTANEADKWGLKSLDALFLLVILDPKKRKANLLAPLLIDWKNKEGWQVVAPL